MNKLFTTRRAFAQTEAIYNYSAKKWGKNTALEYIETINSKLDLITSNPELLHQKSISQNLKFYIAGRHLLIFLLKEPHIFFLSIMHSNMDIENRLLNLEPILLQEAQMLIDRIKLPD